MEDKFQSRLGPVSIYQGNTLDAVGNVRAIMTPHFKTVAEPRFSKAPRTIMEEIPFSDNEITLSLDGLKNVKASGIDGHLIKVLKLVYSTDQEVFAKVCLSQSANLL